MNTTNKKLLLQSNPEHKAHLTQSWVNQDVAEILDDRWWDFSDFVDGQSDATDLARKLWARPWAILREQLNYLWLRDNNHNQWLGIVENRETPSSTFGSPWRTVTLGGENWYNDWNYALVA